MLMQGIEKNFETIWKWVQSKNLIGHSSGKNNSNAMLDILQKGLMLVHANVCVC